MEEAQKPNPFLDWLSHQGQWGQIAAGVIGCGIALWSVAGPTILALRAEKRAAAKIAREQLAELEAEQKRAREPGGRFGGFVGDDNDPAKKLALERYGREEQLVRERDAALEALATAEMELARAHKQIEQLPKLVEENTELRIKEVQIKAQYEAEWRILGEQWQANYDAIRAELDAERAKSADDLAQALKDSTEALAQASAPSTMHLPPARGTPGAAPALPRLTKITELGDRRTTRPDLPPVAGRTLPAPPPIPDVRTPRPQGLNPLRPRGPGEKP